MPHCREESAVCTAFIVCIREYRTRWQTFLELFELLLGKVKSLFRQASLSPSERASWRRSTETISTVFQMQKRADSNSCIFSFHTFELSSVYFYAWPVLLFLKWYCANRWSIERKSTGWVLLEPLLHFFFIPHLCAVPLQHENLTHPTFYLFTLYITFSDRCCRQLFTHLHLSMNNKCFKRNFLCLTGSLVAFQCKNTAGEPILHYGGTEDDGNNKPSLETKKSFPHLEPNIRSLCYEADIYPIAQVDTVETV